MARTSANVEGDLRVGTVALPTRQPLLIVLAALFLLGLLALPFVPDLGFYYLQVTILFFFYATLGTSWTIAGGYGGLISIGHAAFVGLGAYTVALLYTRYDISPWIGLPIGMLVAALASLIVGYPAFRFGLREDYFALATIAFAEIIFELVNGLSGLTGGPQGIPIPFGGGAVNFQFQDRRSYYFIAMVLWLIAIIVAYRLRWSKLGYRLLAIRDDEFAAARAGINVTRTKLIALALSAVIAAAAGVFYAQFFLFIEPTSILGINLSIQIILMAVLGGMGSYLGATLGAMILIPLSQFLAAQLGSFSGVDLVIYGIVLIGQMLFMPYGILGTLRHSQRWRRVIGW